MPVPVRAGYPAVGTGLACAQVIPQSYAEAMQWLDAHRQTEKGKIGRGAALRESSKVRFDFGTPPWQDA